jgi:tetratricopeptide (TPR) repeat protein
MTAGADHGPTQDAYERVLPRIATLTNEKRYDEALRALDELMRSEEHRDTDGWLRRSVIAHRALVLAESGRAADALSEWKKREALGLTDPSDRIEHALGSSACLTQLHRHDEAIARLRSALREMPLSHLGSALGLLYRLAEAYAASGEAFPESYRPLVRAVAGYYGASIPDSSDLRNAVTKIAADIGGV